MGKNGGCVAYMQKIKGASNVSVENPKTEQTPDCGQENNIKTQQVSATPRL